MFYTSKFSFTSTSDTLELQFLELCNKEYSNDETEIRLVTTSYYRFEKEYDGIRIVKEQFGINGIKPLPDAILKFNSKQQIDLEVKLSDVWKFFMVVIHLILIAALIVLLVNDENPLFNILGLIGGIGVLQLMIFSYHQNQVQLYKNMIGRLLNKFNNQSKIESQGN